jgi:hypothetical protein
MRKLATSTGIIFCTLIASVGIARALSGRADPLPVCDAQAIANAGRGFVCTVKTNHGPVSWRVEAVVVSGSRTFRVFQDMKSGLFVSDDLGKHSQASALAESLCTSADYSAQRGNVTSVAWRVPSGYPRKLNGKKGFPNHDSDFVVLEDDGIRDAIPGVTNKWFISSSDAEGDKSSYSSYGYDGEFGDVNSGCDGNGNVSLRCVGTSLASP